MKRERRKYWAARCFVSTRGLHFDFVDVATAKAFYVDETDKGFTYLMWDGSCCVIDTRIKPMPK